MESFARFPSSGIFHGDEGGSVWEGRGWGCGALGTDDRVSGTVGVETGNSAAWEAIPGEGTCLGVDRMKEEAVTRSGALVRLCPFPGAEWACVDGVGVSWSRASGDGGVGGKADSWEAGETVSVCDGHRRQVSRDDPCDASADQSGRETEERGAYVCFRHNGKNI